VGVDRDAVIIDVSTNDHGIEITSGDEDSRDNSIRNLTIKTTNGDGIKITEGTGENDEIPKNIVIENVTISASGSNAVGINGPDSDTVQVTNCSMTTGNGVGIFVDENWSIRDTTVNAVGSGKEGVGGTSGGDAARLTNCNIASAGGDGIKPSGNEWTIEATQVEAPGSGGAGINFIGRNDVQIIDCESMGYSAALSVDDSDRLQARGCKFRGGDNAVSVTGDSQDVLVQDSFIFGDWSIHQPTSRITGVLTADSTNLTAVFQGCKIQAIGSPDEVLGVFLDGGTLVVTTFITSPTVYRAHIDNPDVYRVLSTTSNGSDLPQAVHVVGANWAGDQITDSIPLQNHATRRGEKAFKTVTKIIVPPGTGAISIGTTNELGLYYPIPDPGDVLQQGRKSSRATSYTLEGIFMVHTRRATVEVETINAGDSFEWNYLATK